MTANGRHTALPANEDFLLDEKSAAQFLNLSPRSLQNYRVAGTGPAYRRVGIRKLGYLKSDLLAYLHDRKFSSTSSESHQAVARAKPTSGKGETL